MAELVDALDSKSCGFIPCQFESDYPYHLRKSSGIFRSFFRLFSFEICAPAVQSKKLLINIDFSIICLFLAQIKGYIL